MQQPRYCEVQLQSKELQWKQLSVNDDTADMSAMSGIRAGGSIMYQADGTPFLFLWRTYENIVELEVEGLASTVDTGRLRVICHQSNVSGSISVIPLASGAVILFATSSAIHIIEASTKQAGRCLLDNIVHRQTYQVTKGSPIVRSHGAICNEAFCLALTRADGSSLLASVSESEGYVEVKELRHTSLMSSLWSGVRRSMMGNVEEKGDAVESVIVDTTEGFILFMLTVNMRLRKWNVESCECLSEWNLCDYVATDRSTAKASHLKIMTTHNKRVLGVQWSDQAVKKIMLLDVDRAVSEDLVSVISTVSCGEEELMDFSLISNVLHVLCKNALGEAVIKYLQLDKNDREWQLVCMRPGKTADVDVPAFTDPKTAYCEYLFYSGHFDREALSMSILVMKPDWDMSKCSSLSQLKSKAIEAVEAEISSYVYGEETTNEEYRTIQMKIWQKFTTDVIQYDEVFTEAVGLVSGEEILPNCFVRKNTFSFLRLCDPLEVQALFPKDTVDPSQPLAEDVVMISQALDCLHGLIPGLSETVYNALTNGINIDDLCQELWVTLSSNAEHANLGDFIQNTDDILGSVQIFLIMLDLVRDIPEQLTESDTEPTSHVNVDMSDSARAMLCSALENMLSARFDLCCALTVFCAYIIRLRADFGIPQRSVDEIEDILGKLYTFLHAYTVTLWICRLPSSELDKDLSASMFEALKISNPEGLDLILSQEFSVDKRNQPILEEFFFGVGGVKLSALMKPEQTNDADYDLKFRHMLNAAAQTIWPIGADMLFPEYLMVKNYNTVLERYCHLINSWEKGASCSRAFLMGHCYLQQGEPGKAYISFEAALYGIFTEGYFQSRLGIHVDEITAEQVKREQTKYCLMVMNLFESLSHSEQVIQMAYQTIEFSDETCADEVPALWTKIFKHSLDLNLFDEAHRAMLCNPDHDRKVDCLRQFIVTLCDKGLYQALISYSYKEMLHAEVVSILLDKARSVDLTVRNYYDLLYSFHVFNNDLRNAASVMYECAQRLSSELSGQAILMKQAKCYLACINALSCVKSEYTWLVPSHPLQQSGRTSPKRTSQGSVKERHPANVRIVSLEEIEKEYMLINMRLRLCSINPKHTNISSTVDARELITYLNAAGMYDGALEVAATYGLKLSSIFESLTHRCMKMGREIASDKILECDDENVKWLAYNQLPVEHTYAGFKEQAWNLLRSYLDHHETLSMYHRCVASKLLVNGVTLPEWFIASYKLRDFAELLRLYMLYDKLEESVNLAVEYLRALCGVGYERFGLESSLNGTLLPGTVWVPYTQIDILLKALSELQTDSYYETMYSKLNLALTAYLKELAEMSNDAKDRLSKFQPRKPMSWSNTVEDEIE